jgi:hypothetical protein
MKRTLTAMITIALALTVASAARSEMPYNGGEPEVSGRAAVGWGVVGHNGAWLYADGSACGSECTYTFAWERCRATCIPIPGATSRVYKVRAVDVGARLRVVVTAVKYDCNAHGVDCRWVARNAVSPETNVVPKPLRRKRPRR